MQHSENINIPFVVLWNLLKLGRAYKLTESSSTVENIQSHITTLLDKIKSQQNIQSVIVNWIIPYNTSIVDLAYTMELLSTELNTIPLEYALTYSKRDEEDVILQSIIVYNECKK